jgi:endonuclease I
MRYLSIYKLRSIYPLKIASSLHYCQKKQRKGLKQGESITLNDVISSLSFNHSNAHEKQKNHADNRDRKQNGFRHPPTSIDPLLAASVNLKLKFRRTKLARRSRSRTQFSLRV